MNGPYEGADDYHAHSHYEGANDYPGVDQHQQTLQEGHFARVPLSVDNLAAQIEKGGARIEETLTRLNCRHQSLFFLAAWAVILASVVAIFVSVFSLEVSNLVNSIFLFVLGCILMLLDIPGSPRWAGAFRRSVRKHARFLTRLTGKSLYLFFLGSMVVACLWPRRRNSLGFLLFLTIALSQFTYFVASIGLFIAFRKSLRLDKIRKTVQSNYQGNWPEVYRKYAVNDPSHGMQFEEFDRLAVDYSQGKVHFELADLTTIFNALDEHQKSAINEVEFGLWISGGQEEGWSACNRLRMTYL